MGCQVALATGVVVWLDVMCIGRWRTDLVQVSFVLFLIKLIYRAIPKLGL